MNDVDILLRTADPARSRPLPPEHADALLAAALQRRDEQPAVPHQARSPRRIAAAVGIAAVLLAGTLTVVAVVHGARPRPADPARAADRVADLPRVFGPDAIVSEAVQLQSVPGPEGTTLTLWKVPTTHATTCWAVLDDVPSAQSSEEGGVCDQAPRPGDSPAVPSPLGGGGSWSWTSPTTGTAWTGWYVTGHATAARLELRTAGGQTVGADPVGGTFVTGGIRADTPGCTVLVGLDGTGAVVDRLYLQSDCDPASQVVPTGPARSAADVVEAPWGEAAPWTPAIGVIVNDLVAQPAAKAAHLPAGSTLVTVQLQFYRSGGPPTQLPTDVDFALLAGPDAVPVSEDPGRNAPDPSLTGLDEADSIEGEAHILQRSFDVPNALLGQLAVKVTGDATHPTVILHDSQRAL